jgi:hypothetical protein
MGVVVSDPVHMLFAADPELLTPLLRMGHRVIQGAPA